MLIHRVRYVLRTKINNRYAYRSEACAYSTSLKKATLFPTRNAATKEKRRGESLYPVLVPYVAGESPGFQDMGPIPVEVAK